jgi:hypothetical protein
MSTDSVLEGKAIVGVPQSAIDRSSKYRPIYLLDWLRLGSVAMFD